MRPTIGRQGEVAAVVGRLKEMSVFRHAATAQSRPPAGRRSHGVAATRKTRRPRSAIAIIAEIISDL
jgi:hypothetical protein